MITRWGIDHRFGTFFVFLEDFPFALQIHQRHFFQKFRLNVNILNEHKEFGQLRIVQLPCPYLLSSFEFDCQFKGLHLIKYLCHLNLEQILFSKQFINLIQFGH